MMAAFKGVRFSNIDVAFGDYTTNYPEQIGTGGQVVLFAVDNGPGTMFPLFKPGFTNIYGIQQDSSYDVGIMMQYASSASNIGAVGGSAGAGYNWFAISAYLAPGGGVITDLENIFVPRGALRTQSSNLKGWGGNSAGQLGLSDTSTGRSVPTTISTGSWLAVGGSNICTGAIRSDGTLWMTGLNLYGMLGQGNTVDRSSLTQVGSLADWSNVVVGMYNVIALKTDGSIWSWGYGADGGLGQSLAVSRSSPVRIGALSTWRDIAASVNNSLGNSGFAIKTDNTLWAWGVNDSGQLGLGNTVNRSSPTQVGTSAAWLTVAGGRGFTIGVGVGGGLWAWGINNYGQLGLGNTTSYSSPVRIGALTTWAAVSVGSNHSVALKTDGTMWTWGYNGSGQLGINNTLLRSSPVQVGSLTTWAEVLAAGDSTFALKTDGTVWAWGVNTGGVLGLGDTVNRSSPVQLTSLGNSVRALPYNGSDLMSTIFALTY
jgi:alpha-tubulin suppressor-like RCC1 family protein